MKRGIFFKTKTIQQHLLLCTRRFNTCVTHTPSIYTDWNDIETDRCISEMCAHFSIWAPKCLVQTTVNKSMCLEEQEKKKEKRKKMCTTCSDFIYDHVFEVSNEFDTRACSLSPKIKKQAFLFFKWTSHPDVVFWNESDSMFIYIDHIFILWFTRCVEMHKCIFLRDT